MLAGQLPALEVERVAVGIVGWRTEYADVAVVLRPSHLPVVGNVADEEIAALRTPCRAFRPQQTGEEALDRRIRLGHVIERRIDGDDVRVPEIGGWGAAGAEIARRRGDRRGRRGWLRLPTLLRQRAAGAGHGGTGGERQAADERSS